MAARLTRRAALTAGAGGVIAGFGRATRRAVGAAPLPVTEIAPGIFVHQGGHDLATAANLGAIANVGFVVGDEAVAVIDSGGCVRGGARLRAAIRKVSALPIRYVIASHVHPDHLFGHAAFNEDQPTFVGHRKLPAALAMRGAYYLDNLADELGALAEGILIVEPTLIVAEEASINLGGRKLRLVAHAHRAYGQRPLRVRRGERHAVARPISCSWSACR